MKMFQTGGATRAGYIATSDDELTTSESETDEEVTLSPEEELEHRSFSDEENSYFQYLPVSLLGPNINRHCPN